MPLIFLLSTPPETSISFVLKKSEPVRGHLPDPLPIRELDAPPPHNYTSTSKPSQLRQ